MKLTAHLRPHLPLSRKASKTLVQTPLCYKSTENGNSSASVTKDVTEGRAEDIPSPTHKKVALTGPAVSLHCLKGDLSGLPSREGCNISLQDDTFVWSKQWYPLAAVEDLNPSKPFATKLLGERLLHVCVHCQGQDVKITASWRCQ